MKILWIVNIYIGKLAEQKGLIATSGKWMEAELQKLYNKDDIQVTVCTTAAVPEKECLQDGNIRYVVLPTGPVHKYRVTDAAVAVWRELLDEEQPDIIQLWGTEYPHGLAAIRANAGRIPACVYIQGVISSIALYYRGQLRDKVLRQNQTWLDFLPGRSVFAAEKRFEKQAVIEQEILRECGHVVLENQWSQDQYSADNPNLRFYYHRLPLKEEFGALTWSEERCQKHTILSIASGYPLKGFHILLQALSVVVKDFPDVRLVVPGASFSEVSGMASMKQGGYGRYIRRMIREYGLSSHIQFVGPQSSAELARLMCDSHVFVTASAVENHCSTLREAMTVGTPCISSYVGGIPEYLHHKVNGFLYRYEDYRSLAARIMDLFRAPSLCREFSQAARHTMEQMYREEPLSSLQNIYTQILKEPV